ncbi:MAG: hypothetical protein KDA50_01870 [Rhodobacteraceae bacterium]|nr:hypothetical protein [Paracoccaceae bacterium]
MSEAPVTGFVNNGDQSVVQTLFVYLDGCPLLSLTPPASGKGRPEVTMIEPTGDCATAVGLADKDSLVLPVDMIDDGGMHIQMWQDDPSDLETVAADPSNPGGDSLIIEVTSLYPEDTIPSDDDDPTVLAFGAPRFWIPGVFGNPSGSLLVPAAVPGNRPDPRILFGQSPLNTPGFPRASGPNGPGTNGPGNTATPPGASPIFVSAPNPGGGNGPFDSGTPGVAAVPLPATLLLLLWAFQMLRSFVRRR